MSRPFSQTMQAHELDVHRLWLVLFGLASLLLLIWAGWAGTGNIVLYENGKNVRVTGRVARSQTLEEQDNVYRMRTWQQRFVQASFPDTARGKLHTGQEAMILLRGDVEKPGIAAVITEVQEEGSSGAVQVVLRVDSPEGAADPFAHETPERVQVPVGTASPLSLLPSMSAPEGRPQLGP